MSDPYLSQINLFPGSYVPRGYADCDGAEMPITNNEALFSLIGCEYGGNCSTTFRLPDFRGRVPINHGQGQGLDNYEVGERGGIDYYNLTVGELPPHDHSATATGGEVDISMKTPVNTKAATSATPTSGTSVLGKAQTDDDQRAKPIRIYNNEAPDGNLKPTQATAAVDVHVSVGKTGSGQAINNLPPFLTIRFGIATSGIYPPRP